MNFSKVLGIFTVSGFIADVLRLSGGTILSQAMGAITTPLLTRIYDPAHMGLYGLFFSFITFASVGATLRYDLAIVSARNNQEAHCILIDCLLLNVLSSFIAGLFLWLMLDYNILSYGTLPKWSVIAAILTVGATGVFTSLRYALVRERDFGNISRAMIEQGIVRALTPVITGLAGVGWMGLVLGELLGRGMASLRLVGIVWTPIREAVTNFDLKLHLQTMKRYWKYPIVIFPSSIIDAITWTLPLPIVSLLYGTGAAGQFLLVTRIGMIPASLITASVGDVFHSHITKTCCINLPDVLPILIKTAKKLTIVGLITYSPIALLSPFVFGILFGAEWSDSGILMSVFSPICVSSLTVSPLSRVLLPLNRNELKLVADVFRVAIPFVSFFGAQWTGYEFMHAMIAYSIMHVLTYILYFGLLVHACKKTHEIHSNMDKQLKLF